MTDPVFSAFDRFVESPESDWAELARDEFPEAPELQAEVLSMLDAWRSRPEFHVRTAEIRHALDHLSDSPSRRNPAPEIDGVSIKHELGTGGSGTVYKGRQHAPVERDVAVKVFAPSLGRADHMHREATALARLNHPNIATLYAIGRADDRQTYALLEFIDGVHLTDYLKTADMSLESVLHLFCQICEAVAYANEAGVIHRDLKPANILVQQKSAGPRIKVLDFSIARALTVAEEQTAATEAIFAGTPEYMSPEQTDPDLGPCTTRSDVFSLGTILYEMLAGVHPYLEPGKPRPSILSILQAVRNSDPIPPSVARTRQGRLSVRRWGLWSARSLTGDLDAIVLKTQRAKPLERYPTARALLEDIQKYLISRPIEARRISPVWRLQKAVKRHPATASAAVLSLFASAVIFVVIVVAYRGLVIASANEARAHSKTKLALASTALLGEDFARAQQMLKAVPIDHRSSAWFALSKFIDQSESSERLDEQGIADIWRAGSAITVLGRSGSVWQGVLEGTGLRFAKVVDRLGTARQVAADNAGEHVYLLTDSAVEIWANGQEIGRCEHQLDSVSDLNLSCTDSNSVLLSTLDGGQLHVLKRSDGRWFLDESLTNQSMRQRSSLDHSYQLRGEDAGIISIISPLSETPVARLRGHTHTTTISRSQGLPDQGTVVTGDASGYVKVWRIPPDVIRACSGPETLAATFDGWLLQDDNTLYFGPTAHRYEDWRGFSRWWNSGFGSTGVVRTDGQILDVVMVSDAGELASTRIHYTRAVMARIVLDSASNTGWLAHRASELVRLDFATGELEPVPTLGSPITAYSLDPVTTGLIVAEAAKLTHFSSEGDRVVLTKVPFGTQFIVPSADLIITSTNSGQGVVYDRITGDSDPIYLGGDVRALEWLDDHHLIAAGRADGTIGLYEIGAQEESASLPVYDVPVDSLSYGSDRVLRSTSSEGELNWVDLKPTD